MNIVKPIYTIIGKTTYLDNYTEVVDSLLYDFEKKDYGDMVSYWKGSRSVTLFKTTYKGLVRWEVEKHGMSMTMLQHIYEDLVAIFGAMENEVNLIIEEVEERSPMDLPIFVSIGKENISVFHNELDCLVHSIVHDELFI